MSEVQDFWIGDFGTAYTARNRVDWRKRVPFWSDILDKTAARSVFEVGCNTGYNLSALRAAGGWHDIQTYGYEINHVAANQARLAGHQISLESLSHPQALTSSYDLVFTCGVLIHVPPAELDGIMDGIIAASSQYVLAAEYHSFKEEEISYRGFEGRLWKRDYCKLYTEKGLKPIFWGELNEEGVWDRLTWTLFSK